jgi:hypothetical protein
MGLGFLGKVVITQIPRNSRFRYFDIDVKNTQGNGQRASVHFTVRSVGRSVKLLLILISTVILVVRSPRDLWPRFLLSPRHVFRSGASSSTRGRVGLAVCCILVSILTPKLVLVLASTRDPWLQVPRNSWNCFTFWRLWENSPLRCPIPSLSEVSGPLLWGIGGEPNDWNNQPN